MVKVRSRSQKESVSSYHMKSIELIISHKLFSKKEEKHKRRKKSSLLCLLT